MSRRVRLVALVGGMLLFATPCHAHAIHRVFLWLGPIAPQAAIRSIVGCVPLLALIACQALLLHRVIAGKTYVGALWRAAVIFVLSKIAETAPIFIHPDVVMGMASDELFLLIVILMCAAAVAANALLIRLLYWRTRPCALTIAWLSLALAAISIGGTYIITTSLLYAGIVR